VITATAAVVSLASLALAARSAFSPPSGGFRQVKTSLAFAVATLVATGNGNLITLDVRETNTDIHQAKVIVRVGPSFWG